MKVNDIVSLKNLNEDYLERNLYKNANGIVLEVLNDNKSLVLFLNDYNFGDYATVVVDNLDLKIEDGALPNELIKEMKEYVSLNLEKLLEKCAFEKVLIREYDVVELTQDEKYLKYNIHKGDKGVVVSSSVVKNKVLVDFSKVEDDNSFNGDCVSINIKDLKVIKN